MLNRLLLVNPACDIWVTFGSGKNFHYTHINVYMQHSWKGEVNVTSLLSFCDTISVFYGRGKKTSWEAWKSFSDATLEFLHMQYHPYTALIVQSDYFNFFNVFV